MSNEQNGTSEITAEESLLDHIVDLVRQFMARPNHLYNYDGIIEWHIYRDNTISIHISIHRDDQ